MNKREKEVLQAQLDSEKAVLKELEKQYRSALDDINTKIMILQSDELTQSKIYRLEYQRALKGQVEAILEKLHGDEYSTIQQYLHDSYTDSFIGTMYDMHGQGVPLIMPIDQAAAVKAIQTDSKISEGLYNALGIDTKDLKKNISAEITRGIAGGMSNNEIARNIHNATRAPLSRAKTIARTENHRITQASTYNAQRGAKAKGANVVKQWDSTMDGNTRSTHRHLDGQIREIDEPFEMDGKKAMFPGDFGDPAEDCNCRCVSLQRARWALDEGELKTLQERAAYFGLDKTETFEDFKNKYLKAAEESVKIESQKFTPAKSIKEAEAFARDKLGIECSYKGVDLACANDMNAAFQRGLDYCPDIKGRLNFVGSGQERNRLFKKEMVDYYLVDLKNRYPGQTDEWYSRYAKSFANKTVGRIDGRTYAFASRSTGKSAADSIVSKYSGIVVNNKWGENAESFIKALESDVKAGWHPAGCETIASVFDHEIAHQIDYAAGLRTNRELTALWASLTKENIEVGLSKYGATNINEFIAEGYAEYVNSENPREIARKIGAIIEGAVKKS